MLTSKQESFCNAILSGMNQSDAYRHAYNAEKMSSNTIKVKASNLVHQDNIRRTITEARNTKKEWALDRIVDEFGTNVELGRELGQLSASNAAITGIGKALGILSDKVDVNIIHTLKPGLTLEELEDRHKRLVALEAGVIEGEVRVLDDSSEGIVSDEGA